MTAPASWDTHAPRPQIQAEAAAWLARLHGPNRSPSVDQGFRRWLELSPEHAAAFELANETWDKLAQLRRRPIEQAANWEKRGVRLTFTRAALAASALVAVT